MKLDKNDVTAVANSRYKQSKKKALNRFLIIGFHVIVLVGVLLWGTGYFETEQFTKYQLGEDVVILKAGSISLNGAEMPVIEKQEKPLTVLRVSLVVLGVLLFAYLLYYSLGLTDYKRKFLQQWIDEEKV